MGAGAVGAVLAVLLDLPAPFLTGPATTVTLAALAGLPVGIPARLRDPFFLLIGMNVGAAVTPEAVATAARWPGSLLALAVAVTVMLALGAYFMRRVIGLDRLPALLAATPGHLSFVLSIAEEGEADTRRVALVQSLRVLFLTLLVPVLVQLLDRGPLPEAPARAVTALWLLVPMGLGALVVGLVFKRLNLPAALLLGGMAVSGGLHGSGSMTGQFPPWLTAVGFTFMGSLIGTRFNGINLRMFLRAIVASFTLTSLAALTALLFAVPVSMLLGVPLVAVVIAFAPGGLETMMAMSVLLDANPAYVAAHHVFRLFFLSALIPFAVARTRRSLARAQNPGGAGGQRPQGEGEAGQKGGQNSPGDDHEGR